LSTKQTTSFLQSSHISVSVLCYHRLQSISGQGSHWWSSF
jgi:hypothetical protein